MRYRNRFESSKRATQGLPGCNSVRRKKKTRERDTFHYDKAICQKKQVAARLQQNTHAPYI